jgi:hypothetical protein
MATVTSSTPVDEAVEVYIGSTVQFTVTAARAIDPLSINKGTFVLYEQDYSIVPGSYVFDTATNTATFTPTNPLLVRHLYTCVILGGANGVRSIEDAWGDRDTLAESYKFTFTTNDGRFSIPDVDPVPSGVPSGIIYPDGVDYFTTYQVKSIKPKDRSYNVDPSGMYLDASGLPTLTLCFNKPVNLSTLTATSSCDGGPVTIISRDILGNPFSADADLTTSGTWTSVLWQAIFTFNSASLLATNREVTITVPSSVAATDGTFLTEEEVYTFTTRLDPYYIGVQHVRIMPVGPLIVDIPDDTISRVIHHYSKAALWLSASRPSVIQPFTSQRYTGQEVTTVRPAFAVDDLTGPPEYVKRYVLACVWYHLLRAKYLGYMGDVFSGGGPGASHALDDLKYSQGSGDIYAGTIGPILETLEGNPKKGIVGEIKYWEDYITGRAKWMPALSAKWGLNDKTKPPKRAGFISGTSTESISTGVNE